jgi:two-component sensor histidine kinase
VTGSLFSVHVRQDRDIVYARQRARFVAERLGFDVQAQTRIATAVSEVARNAYAYAGGGKVEFRLEEQAGRPVLAIEVSDQGPGIANVQTILAGGYRSPTGLGVGLAGAKRLVDRLEVATSKAGTAVRLYRNLPRGLARPLGETLAHLADALMRQQPLDPVEEVQRQNQELLRSLYDLRQREEELLAAIAEKEVLLKEVYHRVKNNLQIISSLVSLKARKARDGAVRQELEDVRSRIHSLSILHEKLYQSDDLSRVDLAGYVRDLCSHLRQSFLGKGEGLELTVEADPVSLSLDLAIQLGLLVNEIVTNAFKHAFPQGGSGTIKVALEVDEEARRLVLRVSDNGVGIPAAKHPGGSDSLGMNLIRALAARVEGELKIDGGNGTTVTVGMPLDQD